MQWVNLPPVSCVLDKDSVMVLQVSYNKPETVCNTVYQKTVLAIGVVHVCDVFHRAVMMTE